MFVLECPSQHYDWGSYDAIPRFLRTDSLGERIAEVWAGTHPLGTARIREFGAERKLSDVAGDVGFMLKVIAADRPLSIQVHPDAALAAAGFASEEAAGIPLHSAVRVFKDPRPKPEMVYALSTFDTLIGLRRTSEIMRILHTIEHPLALELSRGLNGQPGFSGIVRLIQRLLTVPPGPEAITTFIAACQKALDADLDIKRAFATVVELAESDPTDVGVVISLLMNRLTLQPGEAAYLATGVIHAHLRGLGLEVMVSSDNVLRAGLTRKHVDPEGLVWCLKEGTSRAARVEPIVINHSTELFAPTGEFGLSVTQSSPAEPAGVNLPGSGQRLLICLGGTLTLANQQSKALTLARGSFAYADGADGDLTVTGIGEIAQAFVPAPTLRGQLFDLL